MLLFYRIEDENGFGPYRNNNAEKLHAFLRVQDNFDDDD